MVSPKTCLAIETDEVTIVIDGGAIAAAGPRSSVAIPADASVLDCSGCTIAPGFWNCHVHFFERRWRDAATIPADELEMQLADLTRYGFTTVFDLSSKWENTKAPRARIESDEVRGPRILTTGEGLIPPGGLPPPDVLRILGTMETPMPEIRGIESAKDAVKASMDAGVDGIKIFISSQNGSRLAEAEVRAAVEIAHGAGKIVFAHVNSSDDIIEALRAAVDVLAHTTPASGAWTVELTESAARAATALTPTLTLWKFFMRHDRYSVQRRLAGTAIDQLRDWHRSGGRVLFGTDYGAVGAGPSTEYALMAEAGLTVSEILATLTTAPAEHFGESDRVWRIATGMAADLVVLEGDPSQNPLALTRVRYTVRNGSIVYSG